MPTYKIDYQYVVNGAVEIEAETQEEAEEIFYDDMIPEELIVGAYAEDVEVYDIAEITSE